MIDAGASNGWYSRLAQRFMPEAEFFLFEPLVEYAEVLESLAKENPKMSYLPTALGSSTHRGSMNYFRGFDGLSSVYERNPGYTFFSGAFDSTGTEQREIDVVSLDDFLAGGQLTNLIFLKMDV